MLGSTRLCFTRFVKLYLNCVPVIHFLITRPSFLDNGQKNMHIIFFKIILIKLTTAARGRHSLVRPGNNSYNNVWEVTERLFPARGRHSLVRRPVSTTFKRLQREGLHGEGGGDRRPRTPPSFIVPSQTLAIVQLQYAGQPLVTLLSINYLVLCI